MDEARIEWTDYMRYRAALRHFDLARIEQVVRYSTERYADTVTGRLIAVGKHESHLIMVPYDIEHDTIRPVTVHVTTRRQIAARIESGRLTYE